MLSQELEAQEAQEGALAGLLTSLGRAVWLAGFILVCEIS